MQLGQLYKQTVNQFKEVGIETPEIDARVMILHHSGFNHADLITKGTEELSQGVIDAINKDINRRIAGEPVFRILGEREFWGLNFKVTPDTLDPRPDTEVLVEQALSWLEQSELMSQKRTLRILDIGTGTGCVLISIIHELRQKYDPNVFKDIYGVGVDFNFETANVAYQNVKTHKLEDSISIVQGDWMSALANESFDLIVSNPPYITNLDITTLSKEVQNHDPFLALSGGDDGLDCYKKIISQLKTQLNQENRAFLEIGVGQVNDLTRLVDDSNLRLCDSHPDLAGIPRVVEICCGDK